MSDQEAAKLPNRFPGIDYDFRPVSYWETPDVLRATLRNVKGANRRKMIEDYWRAGCLDQLDAELLKDELPEEVRKNLGRIHPSFMGGEYLPGYGKGEVEIARISLESTLADVISIRAKQVKRGISLRIVDEYDSKFLHVRRVMPAPLTMGELVDYIDRARVDDGSEGPEIAYGLGLRYTISNYELDRDLDAIRTFTTVESDIYDGLHEHYCRYRDAWYDLEKAPLLAIEAEDAAREARRTTEGQTHERT